MILLCCVNDLIVLREGLVSRRIKDGQAIVLERRECWLEAIVASDTHTGPSRGTYKSIWEDNWAGRWWRTRWTKEYHSWGDITTEKLFLDALTPQISEPKEFSFWRLLFLACWWPLSQCVLSWSILWVYTSLVCLLGSNLLRTLAMLDWKLMPT